MILRSATASIREGSERESRLDDDTARRAPGF
jgi:hypothetical protein